jgi:hypothetical protein
MGEESGEMKSDRIKRNIDVQRSDLGRDIQELERKVKTTFDWRTQFQKNPMTMLGLALGGGVLLSTMIGGQRHSSYRRRRWDRESTDRPEYHDSSTQHYQQSQGTEYQKQKAWNTWDNIKGAVIGVAATKFRTFLDEAIPGFAEEYRKTETEKQGAHSSSVAAEPSDSVPPV